MPLETKTPFPSTNPVVSRTLSAFELLFGAFIVIGHNVFHIVPNEVIILSILGLVSIRLRDGRLSSMGFKRPVSWRRIFLIALVAAGRAHRPWTIRHRTDYWIFLAGADGARAGE